jgi:hypothetical protein
MRPERTLVQDLDAMHADYVEAINAAVAEGDDARAYDLATEYDHQAVWMIADRENRTHLLPLDRGLSPDTSLRRLAKRLTARSAA